MEAGKGTDHEDSGTKTLPESVESNIGIDLFNLGTGRLSGGSLVEDGDHGISWMRDNGAEDSSNVTRHEGDEHLLSLGVFVLWLGEDLGVELCNNLLEGDELDNGVWNLSAPEWGQTLVESIGSFIGFNLVESDNGVLWESSWLGSLHSYFELYKLKSIKTLSLINRIIGEKGTYCFPWAQEAIGDDLGTG